MILHTSGLEKKSKSIEQWMTFMLNFYMAMIINYTLHMLIQGYPLKIQNQTANKETINTRAMTSNRPIEIGSSVLLEKTCVSDAIRLWNLAPLNVKHFATLYQLKKATKTFVITLPI